MSKKEKGDSKEIRFIPMCPYCAGQMRRHLMEDAEGEPFYAWLCDCEVDPYLDEIEEEEEWQL